MAFTSTAVYIGVIVAFVLFVAGIITLLITRKHPEKRKWGWILLVLGFCAVISALVNSNGVFF